MPARDIYHALVVRLLIESGWKITHDSLPVAWGDQSMEIDLGAEYVIGAQNDKLKIAVEIKNFLSPSRIKDFYAAVGQYTIYKDALDSTEPDRILYLAMPVIP